VNRRRFGRSRPDASAMSKLEDGNLSRRGLGGPCCRTNPSLRQHPCAADLDLTLEPRETTPPISPTGWTCSRRTAARSSRRRATRSARQTSSTVCSQLPWLALDRDIPEVPRHLPFAAEWQSVCPIPFSGSEV
jgi:hypothetical protein